MVHDFELCYIKYRKGKPKLAPEDFRIFGLEKLQMTSKDQSCNRFDKCGGFFTEDLAEFLKNSFLQNLWIGTIIQ